MNQAEQLMETWKKDRAIKIGDKSFVLHQITVEESAFMVGFASTVMPMIKQNKMSFMTFTEDLIPASDFDSIIAIRAWKKAKPIIDKSFTLNGMSLDKAVDPFDTAEEMLTFYCGAMSLIAKS